MLPWVDFSHLTSDESDTESEAGDVAESPGTAQSRPESPSGATPPGKRQLSAALHALTEHIGANDTLDDSCWIVDCQGPAEAACSEATELVELKGHHLVETQMDSDELPLFDLTRRSPNQPLSSTATSSLSTQSSSSGSSIAARRALHRHRWSSLTTPLDHRAALWPSSGPRRSSEAARRPSDGWQRGGRTARCLSMPAAAPSTSSRCLLRHLPARAAGRIQAHYYPEGGWGWCVLGCACVLHAVPAGVQTGCGSLCDAVLRSFVVTAEQQVTPAQLAMTGQWCSGRARLCNPNSVNVNSR